MRIAFLILTAYESAGTEHAVIAQANALAARHEVEILSVLQTRPEPHFRIDPRVRVTPLARDIEGEPAAVTGSTAVTPEAAEELRRGESRLVPRAWDPTFNGLCDPALEQHLPRVRADVVVTVTPALLAVAVQLLPQEVRVVHQEHRASAQRSSGMTPLLTFAPRADLVAVLTDGSRSWLEQQLGAGGPPVVTVPNALPPVHRPRSLVDQPLIVSAGRLVVEKRFEHLVEAFGTVADRLPAWRLRIFGSGPQRQRLLDLAGQLGLYDRLELPGVSSDMTSQWAQASICALTSRGPEGLPLVLQEALAAGVPVVSYDCPSGPRDLVVHGSNGLLVPSGSVEGMAQGLLALASDDERRRSMGAAALASAARFDSAEITARWEELFASVVGSSSAAPAGRATRSHLRHADPGVGPAQHTGTAHLTPAEARTEVLGVASAAAARATDGWFVLPGRERELTTLVVPSADRDAFLAELLDSDDLSRLRLRDPGDGGWHERTGSVAELGAALRRDATPRVVLEPWPEDDGVPTPVGHRCGVEVAFWAEAGPELVAPSPGRYDRVAAADLGLERATIDGVEVATVGIALLPSVDDVPGPVDVLVSWDGRGDGASQGGALLRAQLRSVHYHAPWVRRVYVLADRSPDWLRPDHPSVRVVQSPAPADDGSEQLLHLPPGVLLARPVRESLFFAGDRGFRVPVADDELADGEDVEGALRPLVAPSAQLVRRDLGRAPVRTGLGTVRPLTRTSLREAAQRWGSVDGADLTYLAQQLGVLTGIAGTTSLRSVVVPGGVTASRTLRDLPGMDVDTVSVELLDRPRVPHRLREVLVGTLEAMLPRPGPWEK